MLELKNISKTYQMGEIAVHALRGVSLKIVPGEFVAIMGPSGSGKSTLMHVLGLLDRPDSGSYILCGQDVNRLSDEQLSVVRNRLAGFIFQQFHLLPRMTALENTELPLIYAGRRDSRNIAEARISEVGLQDRLLHRPNELSGGQQQRVAIARSLVNDPLIILADEPTGNLDSKSKEEIMAILQGLNAQGKTIVVVTHEKEVAAYARRVIFMRDGQIVSDEKKASPVENTAGESPSDTGGLINAILSQSHQTMGEAKFLDYFRQAAGSMWSHKVRSFLSILGILIGVAAVIAMLALGQGAKDAIERQLASLGSNLLVVRPGSPKVGGVAMQSGAMTRFTFADVAAISRLTDVVNRASPSVSGRGQIVYGSKNWNTQIEGVGGDYALMRNAIPTVGRFFTESEVKGREKVAVIGLTIVKQLFDGMDPLGKTIRINRVNFKVIGILPEKGANTFHDQDDTILLPVTTAMYRVLGKQYVDTIYVEARDAGLVDQAQGAVNQLIIKQHRLRKDEEDSFQIRNMSDIKTALESTTKTMSLLLGSIAAIALLVGGIGIMNIMLVSVSERTREIGLRKAIGATRKDILTQFLLEAVLLSMIGGTAGVLLGAGIAVLITFFAGWAVKVSLFSVLLATTFSLFVGVGFGLWPAQKASQLDSIEALRYE